MWGAFTHYSNSRVGTGLSVSSQRLIGDGGKENDSVLPQLARVRGLNMQCSLVRPHSYHVFDISTKSAWH